MKNTHRTTTVAVLAAVAVLSSGCTAAAGGDKSGGEPQTNVLRLANNDGTLRGVPALRRFISRVRVVSHGRLRVVVTSRWRGGGDEARVIRDVAAGRADLGWAGTRVFDELGVDAFRPLHVPFLIDSYAAESAVVSDPTLGHALLASVGPLGLKGLALVADELRVPAGTAKPVLAPADFAGKRFATFPSGAQSDGLAALGATATSEPVRVAAADGDLAGFETMPWTYQANNYDDIAPFLTANVHLWPRSYVIFGNAKTMNGLGEAARKWVAQAAEDAARWSSVHAADNEPAELAQICRTTARVATASPAQLAALRKAAQPVYSALRANPTQRVMLARIERLAAAAGPDKPLAVPAGCAYRPGQEQLRPPPDQKLAGPGRPGRLPDGVFRYTTTADGLRAHGVDDHDASINAGVWTWTFHSGRWHYRQEPVDPSVTQVTCDGFYDVHGDAVSFTTTTVFAGGECGPPTWTARWSLRARRLTWTAVSIEGFDAIWAPTPWQQVG